MSFWDFVRSPGSARLMVEFGREMDLSDQRLLQRSGLSIEQLHDPNAEIEAAQELCVAGNLVRALCNPPGLGIKLGQRYAFSSYGLWGFGLISSATVGDAITLALRYLPLTYSFHNASFRTEANSAVMAFGESDLDGVERRFLAERDMAACALLLAELAGPRFRLCRFTVATPYLRRAQEASMSSERVYGAVIEPGAENALVFPRDVLSQALPQANALTVAMCEQMCHQVMQRRKARGSMSAFIRHYLAALQQKGLPEVQDIARLTNTSARTIKRRLMQEGTSFRRLLAETRGAMALELVRERGLPLNSVAEQMGYSDLSSFSQAFRRWYGVPPSAYRQSDSPVAGPSERIEESTRCPMGSTSIPAVLDHGNAGSAR